MESPALICMICKENGHDERATGHCTVCETILCDACSEAHKSQKQSKSHCVISLDSFKHTLCVSCLENSKTVLVDAERSVNGKPLCLPCSEEEVQTLEVREQVSIPELSFQEKNFSPTDRNCEDMLEIASKMQFQQCDKLTIEKSHKATTSLDLKTTHHLVNTQMSFLETQTR